MNTKSLRGLIAAAAAVLVIGATTAAPATATNVTLPGSGDPVVMQAGNRYFPRDDQGRAFVMHGFNIKLHGDRLNEVTPDVLAGMRENGFTVLRLATFWADLEPTQGTWNETYVEDLRRILRDADQIGMKVVLTMHQDSYSTLVGGYGIPDWTTRTDGLVYADTPIPCTDAANQRAWHHFYEDTDIQQAQVAAWQKMVAEFKDEPALYGYDLLNEPCGQMNPGDSFNSALTRVEQTQITPMLQRLTNAIRATDTHTWIFLEGAFALTSSLSGPTALGPVSDPTGRQIYAPHIYDLGMESGADWNPASPFVSNYFSTIGDYGAARGIPTIVFEWGPQQPKLPNAADYVHQVLSGADSAVAGWSAFAWCKALGGWCQLDSNGNPGAGMTDTVQIYPVQVAGRPMKIEGDYAAGVSNVTVDPERAGATGPTTFYFPLRRFPNGPAVSVDLPSDRWNWTFDKATQEVAVQVLGDDTYTITVREAGEEPERPTTTTGPNNTTTTAPSSTTGSTTSQPTTTRPGTTNPTTTRPGGSGTTGTTNPNSLGGNTGNTPSGSLPRTGTPATTLALVAVALLATGAAIATARRLSTGN